jgi:branched-chain amino acid transport system ATP-binding protein
MAAVDAAHVQSTLLDVQDVKARYAKREVLHGVSLWVGRGEIVSVLGHNGAGKTTLLRTILGVRRAESGTVTFQGRDQTRDSVRSIVQNGISYTGAENPVFRELTVDSNLKLGSFASRDLGARELDSRVNDAYDMFPRLAERRSQLAGSLSGGEQRMLALSMALVPRPSLMLLDEPSLGLAPAIVNDLLAKVADLCAASGVSVLLVEQNVRAALRVATRVYYLRRGEMVGEETSAESAARDNYWEFF